MKGVHVKRRSANGDARSYADAMRRLRAHQKSAKGAPAYSRFINRRLGRHLAALSFVVGLSPNQVTFISSTFTFAAIATVALVEPSVIVAAGVCLSLLLGYALDSADGQLARLRGGGSPSGEWLDHVTDSAKIASIHAVVLVAFYRFFDLPNRIYLLVPIAYLVVASVWFSTVLLTDQLRRSHRAVIASREVTTGAAAPTLRSILALPADYGLLCCAFITLAWTPVFLALYSVLFLGNALYLAAALPVWFREIAAFGANKSGEGKPVNA